MKPVWPCLVVLAALAASAYPQRYYSPAEVSRALEDAERYAQEGKYEQALERHLWFHKNALKYDPAEAGVRLSFALSDWVSLGRKYPKALRALRSVRNETFASLRKSPADEEAFRDVVSIDTYLGDWGNAKQAFYLGRQHKLDPTAFNLNLDEIVALGDKAWLRDILGTPMRLVEKMRADLDMEKAAQGMTDMPDPYAKTMQEVHGRELAQIVRAVDFAFGRTKALNVRAAALKVVDSPAVRNALATSRLP